MSLADLQALEERYLMRTYKRAPVEFVRGEGALLWDAEGKEYLDFLAGISVCSVGHCNPAVVEAVREQVGRLTHTSNLFYTEPMVRLAERLAESSLGGRVFFTNVELSGAVPQISLICGPCAGGAAYSPALTDFIIMTKKAQMFITGPQVIKQVTGEQISAEALGGPDAHMQHSGVIHFVADNDQEAVSLFRRLPGFLCRSRGARIHDPRDGSQDRAQRP